MYNNNSDLKSTFICPRCDKALLVEEEMETKEEKSKELCELCKQKLLRSSDAIDH
jgi:transcription elongation factor Elf1